MAGAIDLDSILLKLDKVKQTGERQWSARCPVHGDKNPSLSIGIGDNGKLLFYCFAGCTFEKIINALNLKQDVKTRPSKNGRRIVALYDYLDEEWEILFRKLRFDPKGFMLQKPDGKGGWINSIKGCRRIPYNLPHIINANPETIIFIVEGEKDADRLLAAGFLASCNFDGASKSIENPKWKPAQYNQYLMDKTVCVLADNDIPGLAHAKFIANSLVDVASSVKFVELSGLKEGEDISDWLDSGNSTDDLLELYEATDEWVHEPSAFSKNGKDGLVSNSSPNVTDISSVPDPTTQIGSMLPQTIRMAELKNRDFPPLTFLVMNLIALGYLVFLVGRPKSGKSWFALELAAAIDTGVKFLGRQVTKARVLYIGLEDGERRIYQRLHLLKWQPEKAELSTTILPLDGLDSDPGPGLEQIRGFADRFDLIIIDTLMSALSGQTNENDNALMGSICNDLARIAHDTNTAILIIHHAGKATWEDPFNSIRGASSIRGSYDLGLVLQRKPNEREAILYIESRDYDVEDMTLRQKKNGAGWDYVGSAKIIDRIRSGRETLITMIDSDPNGHGLTAKNIAKERGVSVSTIHNQLKRLEKDGHIKRQKMPSTGKGKVPDKWIVLEEIRESKLG